jgi:beta-glucosidase
VGQVPLTYRHHPTGGRSNPLGDYVDGPTSPLWPFGFGLSYTRFEISALHLDRTVVPTRDGEVTVQAEVVNVGDRAGDEVVQLYVRDEEATVARPVRELRGFQRVHLAPGERRTVAFTLHAEQFAYTGADMRRVVEPGRVSLSVGRSSDDLPLRATIELTGPIVDLSVRRHYLTRTAIR